MAAAELADDQPPVGLGQSFAQIRFDALERELLVGAQLDDLGIVKSRAHPVFSSPSR